MNRKARIDFKFITVPGLTSTGSGWLGGRFSSYDDCISAFSSQRICKPLLAIQTWSTTKNSYTDSDGKILFDIAIESATLYTDSPAYTDSDKIQIQPVLLTDLEEYEFSPIITFNLKTSEGT